MKKVLVLCMAVLLSVAMWAQTQRGQVKTRGRMVDGRHVAGTGLGDAMIQIQGRNMVKSQFNGKFSIPVVGQSFKVLSVQKKGYQLVDVDIIKKPIYYSTTPFCLVMEKPEQQMEDLLEAEEKISRNLRQQIRKERQEIQRLKDKQLISEAEYGQRIAKLMESQENNQKRIAEMAKEYAQIDYDQMDDLNRSISDAIINGRFMEADSLLRSKGDMNSRVAEVKKALQAENQQEKELARQQSELTISKAGTQKKLEDIAADCYKFFDRFKMENLHDSAAHYILLRADLTDNAQWQFDAARYFLQQNQYPQSEDLFAKALQNYRHMAAANNRIDDRDIALTLSNLAVIYMHTQRYTESDSLFREAVNMYRRLIADNPQVDEHMAAALLNWAILLKTTHSFDDSETMNKEALDIYRRLAVANPQAYEKDVSYALVCLADLYSTVRRLEEAETLYLENVEILRRLSAATPQIYERYLASTLNNLALLYDNTRQFDKAEQMYQESVTIYKRLAENNPYAFEPDLAKMQNNFAIMYSKTKRFAEAEKLFLEALAIRQRLMKESPKAYEADVATSLANLANLYKTIGRGKEAEHIYQEALTIRRRLATANPQVYEPSLATLLYNLSGLHGESRQYDAAEKEALEALSIRRRLAKANPQVYITAVSKILENIADLYILKGDFHKAEQYADEAISLNPSQQSSISILAAARLFQGKYDEAEKLYSQYKKDIKDIFLEDIELYSKAGVIPMERKADVENVKIMLGN